MSKNQQPIPMKYAHSPESMLEQIAPAMVGKTIAWLACDGERLILKFTDNTVVGIPLQHEMGEFMFGTIKEEFRDGDH